MRRSQRFREEAFGSLSIACRAEEEFQGVSLRIHSAIEVHPHLFHFHIRLIDAPRVVRGFEMGSATFLQFRCVVLHESGRSSCDRRAIPARASSPPGLDSSVDNAGTSDTEQNNLGLEVTPFERGGGIHEIGSSQFSEYRRVYCILAIFATQSKPQSSSELWLTLCEDDFRIVCRRPSKQRFGLALQVFVEECERVRVHDLVRSLAANRPVDDAREWKQR